MLLYTKVPRTWYDIICTKSGQDLGMSRRTRLKVSETKLIPKKMLPEGISLCRQNVLAFLADARLMIERGNLNHALVSVEFATEEIGKILILKKAMESGEDPVTIKYKVEFLNHDFKSDVAWKFLDSKYQTVFDEGMKFSERIFEKGMWLENTKMNHETRCDCAFVDFSAGRWLLGREINKDLLVGLARHIEEKLQTI